MSEQDKKFYATSAFLMIDDLKKENEKLQQRLDKAIEYIKNIFEDEKWYENYDYNDLENVLKNVLNILQGSDSNE